MIPGYIEFIQERVSIFEDIFPTLTDPRGRNAAALWIYSGWIKRFIAQYSRGDDRDALRGLLPQLTEAFETHFDMEVQAEYEYALWALSICVVCDAEPAEYERIASTLDRFEIDDPLMGRLRQHFEPGRSVADNPVPFGRPYSRVPALETTDDVRTYLRRHWYNESRGMIWHGSHKGNRYGTVRYFGYWSWEAAAWVKVNGIDDEELKDQKYYPYDAVHW